MSAGCDVLVVGEYFCDLIFAGLSDVPRPGAEFFATGLSVRPGGCYNMALALTRLGVATAWACDFGTDPFSRMVLEQAGADGLADLGFNLLDRPVQRVSAAFTHHGERGFISFSETGIVPPDRALLDALTPRWLLQTFRFDADWLTFVRAARYGGAKIFGDCRHGEFTLATPGVRDFLGLCDVFSPNEAEALALTGETDIEAALGRLAVLTPVVVIKRGALGALAMSEGRRLAVPAEAVEIVDTIGAGDAFNAGFLAGSLAGENLGRCVRLGVAGGTLSTMGAGSSAVPTLSALEEFARQREPRAPHPHRVVA